LTERKLWAKNCVGQAVMCPSHFVDMPEFVESESQALRVRVDSESSKTFSSRVRVMTWSSHKNCRVTSSHWFASSSQSRVTWNFTFFLLHFYAM